jgi:transcription termination factor Rho
MHIKDLKLKKPNELFALAEQHEVENASGMNKQELIFAVLKKIAETEESIHGGGTIEVLQDGFGFLRSPEANYLAGADDIYVPPSFVRKYGLRTGDTIEGEVIPPVEGERYFALTSVNRINFDDPRDGEKEGQF